MLKVKRTYKGFTIATRISVQKEFGVEALIRMPITAISKTRDRLDEVVLSRNFDKVMQLPSFISLSEMDLEEFCE